MARHDDLIDRLTHRLRVDPELRMDVANELRAHLEDSEADFLAAGDTPDQAAANASKALGDESDLASQLWQANRSRIRLRRVCKWAARVALVPGAILVTLALGWGMVSTGQDFARTAQALMEDGLYLGKNSERMSAEQRLIVFGDEAAETHAAAQKAIVERWPENPIYWTNYLSALVSSRMDSLPVQSDIDRELPEVGAEDSTGFDAGVNLPDEIGPEQQAAALSEVLAELDRGEQADPDNAWYNLIKSALLIRAAATDSFYSSYEEDIESKPPYVHIAHPALFERGLAELRRGAAKPHCRTYQDEMASLRLAALPQATGLLQVVGANMGIDALFFNQWFSLFGPTRNWARTVGSYACQLAKEGRVPEAMKLNRALQALTTKKAAGDSTVIELLVSSAIDQLFLGNETNIVEISGDLERAASLKERNERESEFYRSRSPLRDPDRPERQRLLSTYQWLQPASAGINPEPMRTAEYALIERACMLCLLVVVLVLLLLFGTAAGLSIIRRRRADDGPKLLFVGWGRIGRICLIAIVAPIAMYLAYTRLAWFSPHRFGFWYTSVRVVIEFAALGVIMIGLLAYLTHGAVRQTAGRAGITVPPPLRVRNRRILAAAAGVTAMVIIVYVVGCELRIFGPTAPDPNNIYRTWAFPLTGWFIAAGIALLALVWGVREIVYLCRLRGELAHFRRTLLRSSVGILAAAVIVVGAICGVALSRAETAAVRRITGNANVGIHNELELSSLRELRDHYAERHAELMAASEDDDRDDPGM